MVVVPPLSPPSLRSLITLCFSVRLLWCFLAPFVVLHAHRVMLPCLGSWLLVSGTHLCRFLRLVAFYCYPLKISKMSASRPLFQSHDQGVFRVISVVLKDEPSPRLMVSLCKALTSSSADTSWLTRRLASR